MGQSNPFEALGVAPGASKEEIKKAYRKRANETHPDKGGDPSEFRTVNHCYRLLTDPHYRHQEEAKVGPIEINVQISLEQALFGATITNHIRKQTIEASDDEGDEDGARNGSTSTTVITVVDKIPRGTMTFPFSKDYPQLMLDGRPYDVKINYFVKEHPRYKFGPNGLMVEETIDIYLALKGGTLELETLFGLRTVRVPAGTQMGAEIAIKDHGFLGTLYLVIAGFKLPSREALKKDDKWLEMEINWAKEEELDRKTQEDLNRKFAQLGGFDPFSINIK